MWIFENLNDVACWGVRIKNSGADKMVDELSTCFAKETWVPELPQDLRPQHWSDWDARTLEKVDQSAVWIGDLHVQWET